MNARRTIARVLIGDPAGAALPLSASRLTASAAGSSTITAPASATGSETAKSGEVWLVDSAVSLDESWHGAAVLSRQDGMLLGLLLVNDEGAKVALWP